MTPASPAADAPLATPPRRSLAHRLLALGGALTLAAGALQACSFEPPRPDESLVRLAGELQSLDGTDAAGGTSIFTDQVSAVNDEIVRQCGTDRDGNPPEGCGAQTPESLAGDSGAAEVDVDEVRDLMVQLIDGDDADSDSAPDDDGARDRAVLLTGLHAALATVDDKAAGGAAIDQDVLDRGFGAGSDNVSEETAAALSTPTDLVNQAVYLSGVVLPAAGTNSGTVDRVGDRMRTIRDALTPASGEPAQAGYRAPEDFSRPTDASSAAGSLLSAVHAVTVSLRGAIDDVSDEDRAVVAMLCAVSARSEAALEDALGENPLTVSIRGE